MLELPPRSQKRLVSVVCTDSKERQADASKPTSKVLNVFLNMLEGVIPQAFPVGGRQVSSKIIEVW